MKKMKWLLLVMLSAITITGCKDGKAESQNDKDADTEIVAESENEITETVVVESTEELLPIKMIDDKYRNFYEIFVYSFYDSNQDGIGDFDGLTEKLDYLNDGDNQSLDDLGINGIWLMPIMTSTTYHKYDVVDYYNIDPQYGTMEDFKEFMAACDERDIHVILDMVINHTSSKHPWFVEATTYLKNLGDGEVDLEECPYVDYYNFSKEKTSQTNCQVPGTDWYYEGRFWSEMPDLNLANESVRKELTDIAKFWLDLGVSGFRLDAAKEFYSGNDTANIEVLTWYQGMIKGFKNDAYLVAEVWTDVNTYGKYYESGVDGKELLIVFNISTEESTVDLSDVSLNNSPVKGGDATIKGDLSVGTDTSALEDGILTLPEYGTVVIW